MNGHASCSAGGSFRTSRRRLRELLKDSKLGLAEGISAALKESRKDRL